MTVIDNAGTPSPLYFFGKRHLSGANRDILSGYGQSLNQVKPPGKYDKISSQYTYKRHIPLEGLREIDVERKVIVVNGETKGKGNDAISVLTKAYSDVDGWDHTTSHRTIRIYCFVQLYTERLLNFVEAVENYSQ